MRNTRICILAMVVMAWVSAQAQYISKSALATNYPAGTIYSASKNETITNGFIWFTNAPWFPLTSEELAFQASVYFNPITLTNTTSVWRFQVAVMPFMVMTNQLSHVGGLYDQATLNLNTNAFYWNWSRTNNLICVTNTLDTATNDILPVVLQTMAFSIPPERIRGMKAVRLHSVMWPSTNLPTGPYITDAYFGNWYRN